MTDGNDARSRRQRVDQIICRNEEVSRRYDFEFHALASFHGFPGGVLHWKFSLGSNDFIAWLPPEEMGYGRNTCACPGRKCDFIRFRPNHFREGCPNPTWSFEEN